MVQVDDRVQVIVADNGSDHALSDIQHRWPTVLFIDQPEKGAGPARNAGAANVVSDWIAFLDADCVPDADWLHTARAIASEGTVFGGSVRVFDETEPPRTGAEAFEAIFAFQIDSYLEKGFLPSCQLVMARKDFERVGGFQANVSEDVDWSRRAVAAGLRLDIAHSLRVSHPSRSDWPALRRKWRRLVSEGFLLEGQGALRRLAWAGKAVTMPASVVAHAPRILRDGSLTPRDKLKAIGTLGRLRATRMIWMIGQAVRNKP